MTGIEKLSQTSESIRHNSGITLKETNFDGISYVCPTWDQMGGFNFNLAQQIIESGCTFDRIVALARGGWTWARDLADGLQIPELSTFRIKTYSGVNKSEEPRIVQPLTDSIHGEKILLFDEVIDSGVTVKKAQKYLREMGAKEIHTAALCFKPRSEIKPDFFAFETNSWAVFPHEIREFVDESAREWESKLHLTQDQIYDRLKKIGIPIIQLDYYMDKLYLR